jgi:hypothetical protein
MKPIRQHRLRNIEIEVHGKGWGEGQIFENQSDLLPDPDLNRNPVSLIKITNSD